MRVCDLPQDVREPCALHRPSNKALAEGATSVHPGSPENDDQARALTYRPALTLCVTEHDTRTAITHMHGRYAQPRLAVVQSTLWPCCHDRTGAQLPAWFLWYWSVHAPSCAIGRTSAVRRGDGGSTLRSTWWLSLTHRRLRRPVGMLGQSLMAWNGAVVAIARISGGRHAPVSKPRPWG